jgi:hypothetical protein
VLSDCYSFCVFCCLLCSNYSFLVFYCSFYVCFLVLYSLLSILCVLCFCIVLCIVTPDVYCFFFSIHLKLSDNCQQMETQLQLIDIISYRSNSEWLFSYMTDYGAQIFTAIQVMKK